MAEIEDFTGGWSVLRFAAELYVAAALRELRIVCGIEDKRSLAQMRAIIVRRLYCRGTRGSNTAKARNRGRGDLVGLRTSLKDTA